MKIFLVRHASPDRGRKDIPYDIHPGPMLSPRGEKEARALAEFLRSQEVAKLYYSPFDRTASTAKIVSASYGIPSIEEPGLAEWRSIDETESQVRLRMTSVFRRAMEECAGLGPIGLVSHGGPIAVLLQDLGLDRDELARFRKLFDSTNPLPPAGVWEVQQDPGKDCWRFDLAFMPKVD